MSYLQNQASQAFLDTRAVTGSMAILVNDDNKIVTSTNMKVGAYTIAAQPVSPAKISVFVTAADTADTMGTIVIVGTDEFGNAQTETVTPIAGATACTTGTFSTITSVTGAGWVIDGAECSNDTIIVGTY